PVHPAVRHLAVLDLGHRASARYRLALRRRDAHQLAAVRAGRRPAGDHEVAVGQHLVDLQMEVRAAREIDGHELATRVAPDHRGRDRVALEDVLLVEQLGVPLQVVLVPRLDVFAYGLEIVLGGHGPPSGLSRRFRTTNMRPGRVLLSIRPLAAVPRRSLSRACAVNGPRAADAATRAGGELSWSCRAVQEACA